MQPIGQPAAVLYAYKANYLLRVVRELTARGLGRGGGRAAGARARAGGGRQDHHLERPGDVGRRDGPRARPRRAGPDPDRQRDRGRSASLSAAPPAPAAPRTARWPVGLRLRPPRVARTPWSRFGVAADEARRLPARRCARPARPRRAAHPRRPGAIARALPDASSTKSCRRSTPRSPARRRRDLRLLNLGGGLVPERESLPRSRSPTRRERAASSQLGGMRYAEGAAEPPAIDDYLRGLAAALEAARRRFPWVRAAHDRARAGTLPHRQGHASPDAGLHREGRHGDPRRLDEPRRLRPLRNRAFPGPEPDAARRTLTRSRAPATARSAIPATSWAKTSTESRPRKAISSPS